MASTLFCFVRRLDVSVASGGIRAADTSAGKSPPVSKLRALHEGHLVHPWAVTTHVVNRTNGEPRSTHVLRFVFIPFTQCRDICRKTQTWPFHSCIHFRIYPRPSSPVNSATFPSYRCLSEVDQPPFTWTSNGAEALWLATCQVTGLLCLSRCSLRRRCTRAF